MAASNKRDLSARLRVDVLRDMAIAAGRAMEQWTAKTKMVLKRKAFASRARVPRGLTQYGRKPSAAWSTPGPMHSGSVDSPPDGPPPNDRPSSAGDPANGSFYRHNSEEEPPEEHFAALPQRKGSTRPSQDSPEPSALPQHKSRENITHPDRSRVQASAAELSSTSPNLVHRRKPSDTPSASMSHSFPRIPSTSTVDPTDFNSLHESDTTNPPQRFSHSTSTPHTSLTIPSSVSRNMSNSPVSATTPNYEYPIRKRSKKAAKADSKPLPPPPPPPQTSEPAPDNDLYTAPTNEESARPPIDTDEPTPSPPSVQEEHAQPSEAPREEPNDPPSAAPPPPPAPTTAPEQSHQPSPEPEASTHPTSAPEETPPTAPIQEDKTETATAPADNKVGPSVVETEEKDSAGKETVEGKEVTTPGAFAPEVVPSNQPTDYMDRQSMSVEPVFSATSGPLLDQPAF